MDLLWANPEGNREEAARKMREMDAADVYILPEMFSTAFSSNATALAETTDGPTLQQVKQWANQYQCAFVGSFIAQEDNKYYNRGFFVEPTGNIHFYDKRAVFT